MIAPIGTKWRSSKIHMAGNITFDYIEDEIRKAVGQWEMSKTIIETANKTKVETEVALFYAGVPVKYRKIATENLKAEDTIYNIWNEHTRIISHELDNRAKVKYDKQRSANKVFDLLKMNDEQLNVIRREVKRWHDKHDKKGE